MSKKTKSDTKKRVHKNESTVYAASPASGKEGSSLLRFCQRNQQSCQMVCFTGIIFMYSYYAYLQE